MNKSSNKGDVDIDFYTKLYPSILEKGINTPRKILNYYMSTGKNKKHITNKKQLDNFIKTFNFDWIFYKSILKLNDIHNEFDAVKHFLNLEDNSEDNSQDNSKFINKSDFLKKIEFDIIIYKNYNKDLIEFNNQQLINHFISYGYRENRIYSNKILNLRSSEEKYLEVKKIYEEKISNFKKLDLELKKKKKKYILERDNLKKYKVELMNDRKKYLNEKKDFDLQKKKQIEIENNKNIISKKLNELDKDNTKLVQCDRFSIIDDTIIYYEIINENKNSNFINNKLWCHLHCYDIDKFYEIYGIYIENIIKFFSIVVTYSKGNKIPKYDLTILKVQNIGMDVGPKISTIKFLQDKRINFNYILMLHSKSNIELRNKWMSPFTNKNNIKIINKLLKINTNIGLICTNCRKWNKFTDKNNKKYIKYFLSEFNKFEFNLEDINITDGNMFIINSKIINRFCYYLIKIYYLLYTPYTIDSNWIESISKDSYTLKKFNIPFCKIHEMKKYIFENFISNGITTKDIYPDGMIEHSIERLVLFFTKNVCNFDYLIIGENIPKYFNIKFDAIYFPQFHEIPENNKFWGKGFTEWTMLKPFPDIVKGKEFDMPIYKPHEDIGYYTIDLNFLKKQIKIASDYGINSFMIYHYWFEKCHKVMNKPLEYFLLKEINFNFYLCWANEPWCRKWSGGYDKTDILMLDQKYEDFKEMIEYLIPFFKKPNYQKNEKGEVIYLIYNIEHMTLDIFNKLKEIWNSRVEKENIKISYVFYDNFPKNEEIIKKNKLSRYLFEPMNSNFTIKTKKLRKSKFLERIDEYYDSDLKDHFPYDIDILWNHYFNWGYKEARLKCNNWKCRFIDYLNIIKKYQEINCEDIKNDIIGLPLNWNNIVRRKDKTFLYVTNFSNKNLDELILIIISKIILKYININKHGNYVNRILINAWNEWNEQAILEPNNITGYSNLEVIRDYKYL